jgi:hypothetical protein
MCWQHLALREISEKKFIIRSNVTWVTVSNHQKLKNLVAAQIAN